MPMRSKAYGAVAWRGKLPPGDIRSARLLSHRTGNPTLSSHAPPGGSQVMALFRKKSTLPSEESALPGRSTPLQVPETHFVNGHRILPPFPAGLREAVFGLGCFWGAERLFWQLPGV